LRGHILIGWLKKNIDIRFVINIAILLLLQVFVAREILIHGRFEWYFQDVFLFNLLRMRLVQLFAVFVIILLAMNYIPIKHNRWLHKWNWDALEHGKGLRVLVMVAVFILTWAFSTYGYNYYFNQPHYFDRLLLVFLALLVYVNPIFAIPFAMIAYVISYQFRFPIGFSYTDKQMIFEFVALFGFFVAVRPFTQGRTVDFVFVSLCLIGAYYYFPGIEKLHVGADSPINWITDNNLHHYVPFTYEKGWLSFRSQDLVYRMTDIVSFLRVPFQVFTIVVEIGALFIILVKRRGTIVLLLLLILLHVGIMVSTGIFFWKWIVLDGAIAWFIWRYGNSEEIATIFKPIPIMLSLIIIASGSIFFRVSHLGWWNSPIHSYYKFDVIDTQGDRYDYPYSLLQPYDFVMTQNRLHYINKNKTVTGTAGESDLRTYLPSLSLELKDVPDFIEEHGRVRYNETVAEGLRDVLRVYAFNLNTNRQSVFIPSLIPAPLHIISQVFDDAYNFEYPISEVRIRAVVSFYDDDGIHRISDEIIDTMYISIPDELLESSSP
jgi:hypothetical protein